MPPKPAYYKPALLALGTLLAGVAISAAFAWQQAHTNADYAHATFEELSDRVTRDVLDRMRLYEYGLRGARGTVLTAGEWGISDRLFKQYSATRDVDAEFPGARGFGFIRRVPRADEAEYVQRLRAEGRPDFAIRELNSYTDERYVIEYIEPVGRNAAAVGLDIGSEANRRHAATTALRTGTATITAPITLVQAAGQKNRSLLFLLPVYRTGATPATIEERESAGFGWSYAPLALKEVLADFNIPEQDYWLRITDQTDPGAHEEIFDSTVLRTVVPGEQRLIQTLDREVYGRLWRLELEAKPQFILHLAQIQPGTVFLVGLFSSALLALLVGAVSMGRERARRSQIQTAQLATIVENSADAIIGESVDGLVIAWNQAAERLFGFSAASALGKPLAPLLLGPERREGDPALRRRVLAGQPTPAVDTVRFDQGGHPIAVSVTAGAMRDERGEIVGIAHLIRDNRERIRQEEQLRTFNATLDQQVQQRTQELDQARRDLQTVLDAMPSMIGYWDRNLRNRVANKAYRAWFGVDPEALQGKPMLELLGEDMFTRNQPYIQGALAGQVQRFERAIPMPDGKGVRHSLATYLPDRVDGEVRGFYVIVHDVTEIVESRQALATQGARLNNIIEATQVGTWEWNVRTGEVLVNDRWAAILGYTLAELQPVTAQFWVDHTHPDDLGPQQALLRRHFAGDPPYYACEIRIRHKDGHWLWIQARGRVFTRLDDGRPEWMYGTHQDITPVKAAQAQLEQVVAMLQGVLDAATELSIIATDPDGTITLFNAGAEKMLGYAAQDMIGHTTPAPLHLASEVATYGQVLSAQHGETITGFRVFVHQAERQGAETREWTYVRKDGSHLTVQLSVTAIRNDQGTILGYLGIAQDMTERLLAEQRLRHAKAAAESANTAKSMFLANMSHEIRTPMNAVLGVAQLLAQSPLDDEQKRLLAKLQIAGRSLLGIINDVLDLSKIEAGEMQVEQAPFSPRTLLAELKDLYEPQAQARGNQLTVTSDSAVPMTLLGDATRLRQILANLVSNAIKFTEQGSVHVTMHRQQGAEPDARPRVRFEVSDSGQGMSPEAQGRIFSPFVQADASTTRRFGGTGLGLSIVKRLVELMGGDLGVESAPGQGSLFWVSVPFEAFDSLAAAAPANILGSQGPLQIVVVDDNDVDREVLTAMCKAFGWQTVELNSGMALIEYFENAERQHAQPPDALLVDWKMPQLNGLDALARLQSVVPARRMPVALMVSAQDRADLMAEPHALLLDEILSKPVNASDLFNAVNAGVARVTGRIDRVMQATQIDAIGGNWLAGLRLLLVDDNDINLEVAQQLLRWQGATVQTCMNGKEAVDTLAATPIPFDAVLMDIQMPVMDGYEATREIRNTLNLTALPVLALTAGALDVERRRAAAAGMNAFLSKPLDPTLLVRTIRTTVEAARGAPIPLTHGNQPVSEPEAWPEIPGIDTADASLRLHGDFKLFVSLLVRLVDEFGAGLDLPSQADLHDPAQKDALARRLHRLRGSSGMLGARALHKQATLAEQAVRGMQPDQTVISIIRNGVNDSLKTLQLAAESLRSTQQQAPTDVPGTSLPATPLAAHDLQRLQQMLKDQDLEAIERVQAMAPTLIHHYGVQSVTQLQTAVNGLDFTHALELLTALEPLPETALGRSGV